MAGPSPAVWLAVQRKRTTAREHEPEELFRQRSEAYEKCKAKGAGLWNALQAALSSATPRTSAAPASHAHYLTRYRTTVTSEAGYIVVRAFRKEDHSAQATPLYRNDFHPNGDVVAKANYGNEDRAWKKDGALHNSEILANQRFLAGSELSRTTQAGFPALTRIKRDTVQNDISISVAEIVHPPEDEEAAVTELQSLPGTEDFEALLGTPNGAVQAHLLCDHVAELRATIASISTLLAHMDADFSKRRLNYMTFAISPAAPVTTTGASGSSSNGASSPPKNAKLHNLLFG